MRWPPSIVLELAILSLLVLALCFQIAVTIRRSRRSEAPVFQQREERWQQTRKWPLSIALLLLLGCGFLFLGSVTAVKTYRWARLKKTAEHSRALPVDLHIASISRYRTYTVVVKYRVRGTQYSSRPLQLKFKRKKSSYPLTLYYDIKDPASNSWNQPPIPNLPQLRLALGCAIASVGLLVLLLKFVEFRVARRRLGLH